MRYLIAPNQWELFGMRDICHFPGNKKIAAGDVLLEYEPLQSKRSLAGIPVGNNPQGSMHHVQRYVSDRKQQPTTTDPFACPSSRK